MKNKRLFIGTIVGAMCFGSAVYAEVGDIAGKIYTTDILTQVDGRDIKSYSIDGQTLIALEDLADYGFNVYYNDNIRSLFVTRTGTVDVEFHPTVERGSVGKTAGYYYETDINAYLNGSWIDAYAIDGKMVACVEEMGVATRYSQFGSTRFQMGYRYDDSERLLSLYTNPSEYGGGYETLVNNVLNPLSYYWTPARNNCLHTDGVFFAPCTLGGLPHGGRARYYMTVLENGLIYNAQRIADLYWIDINEPVLSEDGKVLYFINYKNGAVEYKMIELDSLHVAPASKDDYDAAATVRDNDYKAVLDGKEIPLYNIGGGDYIDPDDLNDKEAQVLKDSDYSKNIYVNGKSLRVIPIDMLKYIDGDYNTYSGTTYEYNVKSKTVILTTEK